MKKSKVIIIYAIGKHIHRTRQLAIGNPNNKKINQALKQLYDLRRFVIKNNSTNIDLKLLSDSVNSFLLALKEDPNGKLIRVKVKLIEARVSEIKLFKYEAEHQSVDQMLTRLETITDKQIEEMLINGQWPLEFSSSVKNDDSSVGYSWF